ncbi:TIGR00303 family protein [Pseudanabaena sp. FACHB-1998]|uniref:nicotinate mononucleotide-dependent phosphoribosyltransferase CobT n=1 Tax=Pseudanabaena sp. FACHB-1998 TaxID=2692858 RepID=UPI001681057E|nr:TIGR00303 family protein [Pseudanabaena sp. FACHB-1998]MBD2178851.1 TIGR00303 family protein [Pseudanabaena sp. FACHB-1998]
MIKIYTQRKKAKAWLKTYRGKRPVFACVLGFTETGLIPNISAAGATPEDRKYTAIADAEFLATGANPNFPLPPLIAGASPVLISRAVVDAQKLPLFIFNAGLAIAPTVETINLDGLPAKCVSTGHALPIETVLQLFVQGLVWGEKLAQSGAYVLLSECVVGGTTTALAVLTGLGIDAKDKVNSSHPTCNHSQKWEIVQSGLTHLSSNPNPFEVVATVGDPMQIVVAGMAIAASRHSGVLLAGGTQMLAVYALTRAIATYQKLLWNPDAIVIGTTRWVAEDPTSHTVDLALAVRDVPLLATQLSFAKSQFPQLRAYEQGFVKEGVGAGGAAIAAHLYQDWSQGKLLAAIEAQL